jgi:hypothetical protein
VAELIQQQELDVEVDYYGFALQDLDDTQIPQCFHGRACSYSWRPPVARVPSMMSRSWERAVMPSLGKLR